MSENPSDEESENADDPHRSDNLEVSTISGLDSLHSITNTDSAVLTDGSRTLNTILYTGVLGGGTIAGAHLFPSYFGQDIPALFGVLGGLILLWSLSEDEVVTGGIQLSEGSESSSLPGLRSAEPEILYYAFGLVLFACVSLLV